MHRTLQEKPKNDKGLWATTLVFRSERGNKHHPWNKIFYTITKTKLRILLLPDPCIPHPPHHLHLQFKCFIFVSLSKLQSVTSFCDPLVSCLHWPCIQSFSSLKTLHASAKNSQASTSHLMQLCHCLRNNEEVHNLCKSMS